MATINGSTNNSQWTFKLEVSEGEYDLENNNSLVTVTMYLGRTSSRSYFGGNYTGNITIDGDSHDLSGEVPYPTYIDGGKWYPVASWSKTVNHNADGSKKISVSASLSSNYFTPSSSTASGEVELTTIPRASDIAVSNTDLGQNIPIVIGKKSDIFTSTLTYTIGTLTGAIVEKTSLSNYPWVMSTTLINQIKNAYPNSGSYAKGGIEVKITCKTYNGSILIGSKETTFKLYITDKPTISSATRAELNTRISALTTSVLRHVSQNKFTISANAPTGATITGYRVKNGTQDSGLSTSNIVNLNDIQAYYTESNTLKTKFVVTCIDSRGNESSEFPVVCNFINYIPVSINKTDVSIKRSSGTSTDCKIYLTGNFFNAKIGTTANTITFKVRYKLKTSTTWGSWTTVATTYSGNTFKVNNIAISGTFDYTENYDFELMTTDKIGESDDYSKVFISSVPTEKHHSKGAWIRELSFEKADIFPVGAIYISLKDTNPSAFFAGTWEQIKGKFLVGVDSSDTDFKTSGKTGGEKTHKLTLEEMPEHTHTEKLPPEWHFTYASGGANGYASDTTTGQYASTPYDSSYTTGLSGGDKEHNNLPPYIAVYMFKRVS